MQFVENLIEIMKLKGIKPSKMEKDIGIKQTTFISWKKALNRPQIKYLKYVNISKLHRTKFSDMKKE